MVNMVNALSTLSIAVLATMHLSGSAMPVTNERREPGKFSKLPGKIGAIGTAVDLGIQGYDAAKEYLTNEGSPGKQTPPSSPPPSPQQNTTPPLPAKKPQQNNIPPLPAKKPQQNNVPPLPAKKPQKNNIPPLPVKKPADLSKSKPTTGAPGAGKGKRFFDDMLEIREYEMDEVD